jgi:hypothetical protein
MEPFLRMNEDIVATKAHLSEPIKLAVLDKIPATNGTLGSSWVDEVFLSPGFVYQSVAVWLRQWCACPLPTSVVFHRCSLVRLVVEVYIIIQHTDLAV